MDNYLVHYGVPGQKWGDRRWQNPDGSLTPEGRRHYGYGLRPDTVSKHIKESANDYQYRDSKNLGEKIRNNIKAKSLRDEAKIIENPNAYKNKQRAKAGLAIAIPVVIAGTAASRIAANAAYYRTGNNAIANVAGLGASIIVGRASGAIARNVSDTISNKRIKETRAKYGVNK